MRWQVSRSLQIATRPKTWCTAGLAQSGHRTTDVIGCASWAGGIWTCGTRVWFKGQMVTLPSLFLFTYCTARPATSSESTSIVNSVLPATTSTAVWYTESTWIASRRLPRTWCPTLFSRLHATTASLARRTPGFIVRSIRESSWSAAFVASVAARSAACRLWPTCRRDSALASSFPPTASSASLHCFTTGELLASFSFSSTRVASIFSISPLAARPFSSHSATRLLCSEIRFSCASISFFRWSLRAAMVGKEPLRSCWATRAALCS
mmetsp:Transcript_86510/g.231883  ORF Transcript_86510/g.231883 Transcript_86510/m.231883 type:complete len:266 (+) Transcript_86510:1803-2600(+)